MAATTGTVSRYCVFFDNQAIIALWQSFDIGGRIADIVAASSWRCVPDLDSEDTLRDTASSRPREEGCVRMTGPGDYFTGEV